MAVLQAIVGVDVGGTNTDAVVVDKSGRKLDVIASAKTHTTADVTLGVSRAIHLALINSKKDGRTLAVQQVNIGTTHFINAVIEGKRLAKVAVIRLCGTSSLKLPPFSDFTKFLKQVIQGSLYMLNGGYQFDGQEITAVDEQEVVKCVRTLKQNGERNIVVCGIFSPVRPEQEERVLAIIKREFPEASVTLSNKIGKIGILERENAAILNECIKPLCSETIKGFRQALEDLGLKCPMYLTQNDGTILNEAKVLEYPVLSFACGATNSMRGAAFLSGLTDAIVADIGGTSCDVGILMKGLPREASSEVKVGGIRTNFRMPDVVSIGLGGGSYVQADAVVRGKKQVKVGPLSAGYKITSEAFVFAEEGEISSRNVTALDIAVAAGLTNLGEKNNVKHLKENFVKEAVDRIQDMLVACIDQMRFSDREMPLILVGGGSVIIDKSRKFEGVSEVILPEHFDVANAVGSVLSQVSSTFDQVLNLESLSDKNAMDAKLSEEFAKNPGITEDDKRKVTESVRKPFLENARQAAFTQAEESARAEVQASGAVPKSVVVVEKDDIALTYIPGNATRIKLKVVGDLKLTEFDEKYIVPESVYNKVPIQGQQTQKQTVSTSGTFLSDDWPSLVAKEPQIDPTAGEWMLNSYDVECLAIGAGIMGCGGGGNPHVGRLLALKALEAGKKIRVVTPTKFYSTVDPDVSLVAEVAGMGAPLISYEKLVSGKETVGALQGMIDLYEYGNYDVSTHTLRSGDTSGIQEGDGIVYIDDYKRPPKDIGRGKQNKKLAAIVSTEIGGLNCIEPLIVAAEMNLPVLDCDGMGRAFPELQMCSPFIYGHRHYPAVLADDKGRRERFCIVTAQST